MRLHLAGRQPLRRQRDDQLVHPRQPPLPLRDDLGLEAAIPVAGHLDLDRPDLGQHRLRAAPVTGVPAVTALGVVLAVAEVIGELALERGLHQPLPELCEQPAFAGQRQPALTGPPDQTVDQLLIDRVKNIRPRSLRRSRLVIG
jgi:hypothetical protein